MPKRPPADLGAAGRRLYRDLTTGYVLNPADQAVAVEAARTADALAELADLAGAATGSEKRLCLAEQRSQRLALSRLLRQLGLPDDDVPAPEVSSRVAQMRARHAERQR